MTVDIYAATESDGLSQAEYDLYELIMAYRATAGLPRIPLSTSLTIVAGRHTLDTVFNIWEAGVTLPDEANLHSWSDAIYYADHSLAPNMWEAPQRLGTSYTGSGYEISAAGQPSIEAALEGWQGSTGHDNVIMNRDSWANIEWNAIGIGVYQPEGGYDSSKPFGGTIYHVWFGRVEDPAGLPDIPGVAEARAGAQTLSPAEGESIMAAAPSDLYGDTVTGFGASNEIELMGVTFSTDDLSFSGNTLGIDHDGDGSQDGSVTFNGTLADGGFMAVAQDGSTFVSYHAFRPSLSEMTTVEAEARNGVTNQRALTGDGTTNFKITLSDAGVALQDNALGVVEIGANGDFVDVQLLFADTNADKSTSVTLSSVEAGHQLNFFLIQGDAGSDPGFATSDTFSFITRSGSRANLSDGSDILLARNGFGTDAVVFHSFDVSLNSDGVIHVLSGLQTDGDGLTLGFEDMLGGGDNDFQDVVIDVDFV